MGKIAKRKRYRRHEFGAMGERGDFKDGRYQVCVHCGAVRFRGDRYAYGRVPCKER